MNPPPMPTDSTPRNRFTKVLVANRGEIAVRVIRGAKKAGYRTVAVYSDADAQALHVREADEAVRIGPGPAKESYLVVANILAAARATGAGAIHPGYGFLSEREDFAQAVADAGLVFVGPDAPSIAAMGNKSASKDRMLAAGVPCVPGYQGSDQSDERLAAEAVNAGLPVMVKAAAGGGGRGMRLVHDANLLPEAIRSARSEAANAFGSGQLLIEKAVVDARHVEIQVFGDRHGSVVYLGERDCSVQRRNQKVVEEAPGPSVTPELRARMGRAAVAAAKAVDYVGAGTVEFLLAPDGAFYFLEMNTRLQVEHPVTEEVYGVDLVAWQLAVAQGEKIPLAQDAIDARRHGWAIEVRLCSEDPAQDFLPQAGRVAAWTPPAGEGVRVDTWLETGTVISPFYDSMQAKIIARGADRETARARLVAALAGTRLAGVVTNRDYLLEILRHPAFVAGEFSTGFIGKYLADYGRRAGDIDGEGGADLHHARLAALALVLADARRLYDATPGGFETDMAGWHSSHAAPTPVRLETPGASARRLDLSVQAEPGGVYVLGGGPGNGASFAVRVTDSEPGRFRVSALTDADATSEGATGAPDSAVTAPGEWVSYTRTPEGLWLDANGTMVGYRDITLAPAAAAVAGSDGKLRARSDGRVAAVLVAVGDRVEKGQTLAVLEAMKMEFQMNLPVAGTVTEVSVAPGQQVRNRQVMVAIKPEG